MVLFHILLHVVGCGRPALEQEYSTKSVTNTDATLKKIVDTNTLTIGFSDNFLPFSYISPTTNQPMGYAIDISQHIANQVKKQLDQPHLIVNYKLLEQQDIPQYLKSKLIDFECSINKNTALTQPDITFSVGFFVTTSNFLVRQGHTMQDYNNLRNQTVAVVKDSIHEKNLTNFINKNKLGIKVISTTIKQLPSLLEEQSVDVVLDDAILLEGLRLGLKNPKGWYLTEKNHDYAVYACTLRKSDEALKQIVNNSLVDLYASGGIYRLYDKWFKSPLPNSDINLNYLLSMQNVELFAKPYDTPTSDDILRATEDISKAFNIDSK